MADFKKPALPFNAPGLLLFIVLVIPVAIYIGSQNLEMVKPVISITVILSGLIIFISARLTQKDLRFAGSPLHLPLTAFLLYCSLSAAFSVYSYSALEELFRLFSYIALVYLALNGLNTLREIKKLMFFWLLVSAAVSIYGLLQNYGIDWINWGVSSGIFISTFGNKNFFAGFLCLVIPVSTAFSVYYWRSRRIRYFVLLTALTLLLSVCLLMTYSKGAWFGFAGGLAFMFVADLRTGLTPVFRKKAFWAAVIIAALLGLILMPQGFWEEWSTLTNMKGGSNRIRLIMWYTVMGSYRLNPVFGVGMGNFREYFPTTRPPYYHIKEVSHNTEHAHSELLEILMEMGLVGLGLYLLIYVAFIKTFLHFIQNTTSLFRKYLILGLAGSLVSCIVDNIVSTNLRWTAIATFFWIAMGLFLAAGNLDKNEADAAKEGEKRPLFQRPRLNQQGTALIYGAYGLTVVFLAITLLRVFACDMYLNRGEFFVGSNNWPLALESLKKSIALNPSELSSYYKISYALLSTEKYEEALDYYKKNMELAPNYAQIHFNLALLYIRQQKIWAAVKEFLLAVKFEDRAESYGYLGDIYRNGGDQRRAAFFYKKGLKIELNNIDIRRKLTSLYYSQNDNKKALEVLKISSIYMPDNAEILQDVGALYLNNNEQETAVYYFKKAINADPGALGAYYNLLITCRMKNDIGGAMDALRRMVKAAADKKDIQQKDRDILSNALPFYEEVSRQNPGIIEYYLDIALGYRLLGDRENSRRVIQNGVMSNPQRADYLLNFLKSLG